uniref:ATP synthase complex subunit 8 n=1 Tax=Occasjapyx japonicus TaxID=289462 RepID=U3KTP4_9HEXA|nr:ATP synthase F0 subunit 8 [Occasjapyx japonicus]AEV44863.1 ATP synthase F0 subunit 8 [Occasjapyx japonicus]
MPQMSPLLWLILLIFFSLALISFNTMNFFALPKTPTESVQKETITQQKPWKW